MPSVLEHEEKVEHATDLPSGNVLGISAGGISRSSDSQVKLAAVAALF
jgi:hypothetical protein